jgi:MFS superfamily sulfate permease-like transporter
MIKLVLASMPPVSGLYTAIIAAVFHWIFAIYPYNSLGPFAVVSLMMGNALLSTLEALQLHYPDLITVVSGSDNPWITYPLLFPLAELMTFSVGIIFFLFLVFNLGKYLDPLLPKHIIAGFTVAAALSVITSQLKGLFGIRIPSTTGTFILFKSYTSIFSKLTTINWAALSIGVGTIVSITALEKLDSWIMKNRVCIKYKLLSVIGRGDEESLEIDCEITKVEASMFPKVLVVVVLVTFISYFLQLHENYKLAIVGVIPTGLPEFHIPWRIFSIAPAEIQLEIVTSLLPNLFSIVLVIYCTLKSVQQAFPFDESTISPQESSNYIVPVRNRDTLNLSHVAGPSDGPIDNESSLGSDEHLNVVSKYWSSDKGEMISLFITTIICSMSSGIVVSPSLSRSAILATQTSAATPLGNSFSGVMILLGLIFLSNQIAGIPIACLSGIVIVALKNTFLKILDVLDLYQIAKTKNDIASWRNLFQWSITFVSVVIFDPSIGLIIAIGTNQILRLVLYLKSQVAQ